MVTKSDYSNAETKACLSVLIEILTVLHEHKDNIVLLGGWIPYFLCEAKKHAHTGSLDIDLALDFKKIPSSSYASIMQKLEKCGYKQGKQPFIFHRLLNIGKSIATDVEVDFLSPEYGGTSKNHRSQKIQDILARKARGCDLVFDDAIRIKLNGKMPDGAENEVYMKIAGASSFLAMKGMALWDRRKEKDAYDIYFVIDNYPGGVDNLINVITPYLSKRLMREGLEKIRSKFNDVNSSGPVWVANFLEIGNADENDFIQRDAFEKVKRLLDAFNIMPYTE